MESQEEIGEGSGGLKARATLWGDFLLRWPTGMAANI